MECTKAKQLILESLDQHIAEEERRELEAHLQSCPECRAELQEWSSFFSDIQILAEPEQVPDQLTETIMSRIQQGQIASQLSWWERLKHMVSMPRFSLRWVAAAASVSIASAMFVNFVWLSPGISPNGLTEVHFSLKAGAEPLSSVAVVGDFNDWNPERHPLQDENQDGVWTATLKLEPGRYEYMFILDGQKWVPDPEAYQYVRDGFGNKNAIIEINHCS